MTPISYYDTFDMGRHGDVEVHYYTAGHIALYLQLPLELL